MNGLLNLEALAVRAAEQVAEKVLGDLDERIKRVLAEVLVQRDDDSLQPLARILGITADAARMRLQRDAELTKLGIVTGSYTFATGKHAGARAERLKFRPSEVRALLASRRKRA